ncbi:alpha/beta hydrolase [Nocardioides sp.]|nr:alpha/beta hydrolase [Nocardioides sp.]
MGLPEKVQRPLAGRPVVRDGQTLATDLQLLLRLQSLARRRDEQVPIEKMRDDLRHESGIVGGRQPIGAVRDLEVAGRPARHYLPTAPVVPRRSLGPLLVFFHGGGFMEGDLDSHDAPCRVLAERSGVPVLAVDYRLAPEHTIPAAHEDAYDAFRWIHKNAEDLRADPARVAVGGDSAGANLAAWVAIAAARDGVPVAWQMLVYPCADALRDNDSARIFSEGFYLTKEFMDRANSSYTSDPSQLLDERLSPVRAELPEGLAPAFVATAGFDPLRDEGEAYARRLADAGVSVELERFADQIHGFLNIVGVGRTSRAAVLEIAGRLRAALV